MLPCKLKPNINRHNTMKQLNTYDTKEEGEAALAKIDGPKRLASERDSTETIYNLFGSPTWTNFYKLNMFSLQEFEHIVDNKKKVFHITKRNIAKSSRCFNTFQEILN